VAKRLDLRLASEYLAENLEAGLDPTHLHKYKSVSLTLTVNRKLLLTKSKELKVHILKLSESINSQFVTHLVQRPTDKIFDQVNTVCHLSMESN